MSARAPFIDDSFVAKLLPFVLGVVAGSVDIIGFLGLDGLFTAHITGDLVLAANVVTGGEAALALSQDNCPRPGLR